MLASSVSVHPLRTVDGLADRVSPIHHPTKKLIENLNISRNMDYYFMTSSKTYLWQWKSTHLISSCLTFPLSMKSITICYNWREHGIQPIHHPKAKEAPSHVKNPHLNLGIFFDHLNCTYCNFGLLKAGSAGYCKQKQL